MHISQFTGSKTAVPHYQQEPQAPENNCTQAPENNCTIETFNASKYDPQTSAVNEFSGLEDKVQGCMRKIKELPDANISNYKPNAMEKALSSSEMNVNSVSTLKELRATINLKDLDGKTTLRKALEISDYEEISQLLKLGASLDDLSGKGITRILYENHLKTINFYDFDNLIDCLDLLYRNKKNDTSWINSSKIQLAFCIAQSTYTIYENYLGNKFKENLLWLIRELLSSEICWNTKDKSGKTAYDYAKECEYEELIKAIENIVKK